MRRGGSDDLELDRRRLLTLSALITAGFAGCSAGGGDTSGTTAEPATTAPTTSFDTSTSTVTVSTSSNVEPTTSTATSTESTTEPATTEPTTSTTPQPVVEYGTEPVQAPSGALAPQDGWAHTDWLAWAVPEVVTVTSLDPEGPGSLRSALERSGPRIVVFEVGGVIDLGGEPDIEVGPGQGSVYVAGQTAPSPGITVIRGKLFLNADHCVLQHLRVLSGDEVPGTRDSIGVGERGANVIVDHCTAMWGTDETLSTGGTAGNHDVTFSHNLVAEALYYPSVANGRRGKATLVMDHAERVAILESLHVDCWGRNPVLKGGTTTAVVNNHIVNYGAAITMAGTETYVAESSIVGNSYADGPSKRLIERSSPTPPRAYAADNDLPYGAPLADDGIILLDDPEHWPAGLEPIDSAQVPSKTRDTAGARPADRLSHETRVVHNAANYSGEWIDSQSEVGGYPSLERTERDLDPPATRDGLAEWLVQHARSVELGESPP